MGTLLSSMSAQPAPPDQVELVRALLRTTDHSTFQGPAQLLAEIGRAHV